MYNYPKVLKIEMFCGHFCLLKEFRESHNPVIYKSSLFSCRIGAQLR